MRRAAVALVFVAALAACKGPPQLGATEQQVVNASPSSWDFGPVPVGGSATPRTITVSVGGLQNEYHQLLSVTEGCADFELGVENLMRVAAQYDDEEADARAARFAATVGRTFDEAQGTVLGKARLRQRAAAMNARAR